jgi:hypothetical protein
MFTVSTPFRRLLTISGAVLLSTVAAPDWQLSEPGQTHRTAPTLSRVRHTGLPLR